MFFRSNDLERGYSPAQVKAILQSTGATSTIETACMCRVDAFAALTSVAEDSLTIVPNALTLEAQGTHTFSAFGGSAPYEFTSSHPDIAAVTTEGQLTAKQNGKAQLSVLDSSDVSAKSRDIRVGMPEGPANECPMDNQQLCDLFCQIMPDLPWCK